MPQTVAMRDKWFNIISGIITIPHRFTARHCGFLSRCPSNIGHRYYVPPRPTLLLTRCNHGYSFTLPHYNYQFKPVKTAQTPCGSFIAQIALNQSRDRNNRADVDIKYIVVLNGAINLIKLFRSSASVHLELKPRWYRITVSQ